MVAFYQLLGFTTKTKLLFTKKEQRSSQTALRINAIQSEWLSLAMCNAKLCQKGIRIRNLSLCKLLADTMTITSQFLHAHRARGLQKALEASGTKRQAVYNISYSDSVNKSAIRYPVGNLHPTLDFKPPLQIQQ